MKPYIIVVLGMHRSGTSLITRSLKSLGFEFGDNLIPEQIGVNDKGFWEDNDIVSFNEELLLECNKGWWSTTPLSDQETEHLVLSGFLDRGISLLEEKTRTIDLLALKDPRVGILIKFWDKVFKNIDAEIKYILALRNPMSVASSLLVRDKFGSFHSYMIWNNYLLSILASINNLPWIKIEYEDITREPEREIDKLSKFTGLNTNQDELNDFCANFLEKSLEHTFFDLKDLEQCPDAPELSKIIYRYLSAHELNSSVLNLDTHYKLIHDSKTKLRDWLPVCKAFDQTTKKMLGLKDQAKFARIEAQQAKDQARIEAQQAKDKEEQRRIEVKRLEELASKLLIFNKKVKSTIPWKIYIALKSCKKTTINSLVKISGHGSAQLSKKNPGFHSNSRKKRNKFQRAVDQCKYLILLINRRGGIRHSISLSRGVIERNGIANGLKIIAKSAKGGKTKSNDSQNGETNIADINTSLIRPLYLRPEEKLLNLNLTEFSCAIHIYVESIDILQKYLTNLSRVPVPFDLYITSSSYDLATINNRCEAEISSCKNLGKFIFTELGHTSQHISTFIVSQQKALLNYKYLLHLQACHIEGISNSSIENDMVDILLAGENQIKEILYLLQSQANLVIAETKQTKNHSKHNSKNLRTLVERILKESQLPFDCHPDTRFDRMPKSLMFWCNDTLYRSLCGLRLSINNLTHKDLPSNASIDKAIEVIIGLMSYGIAEQKIVSLRTKIFNYASIFYEDHIDYSKIIQKQNQENQINMLAYFLPQFSETFENNIWHGNGFTEWVKCQESNPLFEDHYQQRVPHKSIGYYDLKNHSELIRIRKSMRFSGIDGLIFYHYWFSGTKILNSTIESLISSEIEIPFCFCWANENWTRAWDGEDKEILMKQNYSLNDARSFITDLIPYFRDNRYINVDNRPMLFVYRPSSNPMMKEYVKIWKEECIKNNINEPYLVCCLTRESTNPFNYNFDCGVERVLHDWTDGKAQDISKQQDMFNSFTGSVLNYEDVATVYKNCVFKGKSFPLIRSIVPMWDNTARYKDRAFVVHNSSPEAFYDWLKYLYENAENLDDKSSKFVVINAWNEWAEGAYIEPDTKYGYAYMNAIGKVKANYTFRQQIVAGKTTQTGYRICINIDSIQAKLSNNKSVAEKFWLCIETAFKNNVVVVNENCKSSIPCRIKNHFSEGVPDENGSINLIFSSIELIGPNFLNDLLECLSLTKRHTYIIQSINESLPLASGGSLFVEQDCFNHHKGIIIENNILEFVDKNDSKCNFTNPSLVPGVFSSHVDIDLIEQIEGRLKDYGTSLNAEIIISVIIRIHATAKMELFENSIFCLYTMVGNFTVRPIICCQDLEIEQYKSINKVLQKYKWHKAPVILQYTSSNHENDCRARMLTEPLLTVESDYFAYLDYDDLLYPHAYIALISNLLIRGKNITFGRVFKLEYDPNAYLFTKKSKAFESGTSYKDFLDNNRFPIHSFLISKKAIDNKELSFIPGMKYMEDYYLLLQLIDPDSSDWLSATEKIYIGEYMHDLHNGHGTLSRGDLYKSKLLSNSEYLNCERLIQQARASAQKINNQEI